MSCRLLAVFLLLLVSPIPALAQGGMGLHVGFAEVDVTPELGKKPVYLAGFGKNRTATNVHDRLYARAVVLADGKQVIALAAVDVVGLFLPFVEKVRSPFPEFAHVLISSTHNHEGPDTMGLWGPSTLTSGIDPDYMATLEHGRLGHPEGRRRPHAGAGTDRHPSGPELVHDGRQPIVKHDELVALEFLHGDKMTGIVVQWNCHPETLDSKNTRIAPISSARPSLISKEKYALPVVYFTGTVGGLMTSLHLPVADENGTALEDGTSRRPSVTAGSSARLAEKALAVGKPVAADAVRDASAAICSADG